jgi:hypothetical protein
VFNSKLTLPQRMNFSNWRITDMEKAAKAAFWNCIALQKTAARY